MISQILYAGENNMSGFVFSLSHLLIAAYFLLSVYQDIQNRKETTRLFVERKVPSPEIAFAVAMAWKTVGALALLFSGTSHFAAWALMIFILVNMFVFRSFWDKTGKDREITFRIFISDLAILGGLWAIA